MPHRGNYRATCHMTKNTRGLERLSYKILELMELYVSELYLILRQTTGNFLWIFNPSQFTCMDQVMFTRCSNKFSFAQNAYCSWDIYLQLSYNHRSVILPVLLQLSAFDWLMITRAFFHWEYLLLIKVQEVEQRDNTYVRHC